MTVGSPTLLATLAIGVLLCAGCAPADDPAPAAAPTAWDAVSATGAFRVRVGPRDGEVPIGRFHDWIIAVTDGSGQPVYPARIGVNGGMPGHGHGMPTQPQVTEYLGDGRYLIEGMKFNMAGAWVLAFGVESDASRDRIEIEIELEI